MSKKLVVIASYNDWRQEFYEKYTRLHNKRYCFRHNFEYIELSHANIGSGYRNCPTWDKFYQVKLISNNCSSDDIITHVDADMCINDQSISLETAKSFGYAIDSCNTHCMGMYTIRVNEWSLELIDNILSEERYNKLANKQTIGSMDEVSSFWEIFREQASWYSLAGIKRHSWIPFILLPHWGWGSEHNEDTVYNIQELYKHVEIFPTPWNVTHIPEEDGEDKFYMIPTAKSDVTIRHFAGGRKWNIGYFL